MSQLRDRLGFEDPDAFYETLVTMHHGLTESQSRLVMARLILLLANHIGDRDVLDEAVRVARSEVPDPVPCEPERAVEAGARS